MISSLGLNPHECEAIYEDIPSVKRKIKELESVMEWSTYFGDPCTRVGAGKSEFAKRVFFLGQCLEGLQFYGLFAF